MRFVFIFIHSTFSEKITNSNFFGDISGIFYSDFYFDNIFIDKSCYYKKVSYDCVLFQFSNHKKYEFFCHYFCRILKKNIVFRDNPLCNVIVLTYSFQWNIIFGFHIIPQNTSKSMFLRYVNRNFFEQKPLETAQTKILK